MRWAYTIGSIAIGAALIVHGGWTRGLGMLCLVAALGFELARRLGPRSRSCAYPAGEEATFAALGAAINELHYRVLSSDQAARTMTFNTGMSFSTWSGQDYTAAVRPGPSAGSTELELTGQTARRGLSRFQVVSWGETDRLARRLLKRVGGILEHGT